MALAADRMKAMRERREIVRHGEKEAERHELEQLRGLIVLRPT